MTKDRPSAFVSSTLIRMMSFTFLMLWVSGGYPQAMNELQKGMAFAEGYKIDSAYIHLQKAVRLSKNAPEQQKALIYVRYGKLLKLKERTDSTFYYLQKSAEIYKKYRNNDSLLFVTTSIAELFRFRNNKEKAGYYITKAEKLLTDGTAPNIRAYYYNRRAGIENMFFSKQHALKLSEKVIAMQDQVSDKETILYSYNELGALYENKEPEKSAVLYFAALDLADRYNLLIPKADVLVNLSRHATIDEKISRLEEAYEIGRYVDNKDMQFKISNLLFWPYKEKGDYKKAFEYCYIALALEDQMYDTRALAKTAEMEQKYNLSKAQQELRHKNSEVISAQKTTILTTIVFALTLIVLFVMAYFYRKARKKNKILSNLSEENKFLLSEANHRINNNLQLITIMISDELRKQPTDDHDSLAKVQSKVGSIALLHRHLYKAGNKRNMNVGQYLKEVLDNFSDDFSEQDIRTSFRVENIFLPNEEAIYMGLLVTELCINAIKHAFAGQEEKHIIFDFIVVDDNIIFRFSDNGKDVIGKEVSPKLAHRLCRQLKITWVTNTDNGFLFYFEKKLNL